MKQIRMTLSLKMAGYFLTTAKYCSGPAKARAIEESRKEITRYWAIKRGLL